MDALRRTAAVQHRPARRPGQADMARGIAEDTGPGMLCRDAPCRRRGARHHLSGCRGAARHGERRAFDHAGTREPDGAGVTIHRRHRLNRRKIARRTAGTACFQVSATRPLSTRHAIARHRQRHPSGAAVGSCAPCTTQSGTQDIGQFRYRSSERPPASVGGSSSRTVCCVDRKRGSQYRLSPSAGVEGNPSSSDVSRMVGTLTTRSHPQRLAPAKTSLNQGRHRRVWLARD